MPKIKYCPAKLFLEQYLPKELTYREQQKSGGGKRVLLYWDKEIQCKDDALFSRSLVVPT